MESNLYVEGRRLRDERYADLVLGKRNWQIAATGLLLLGLILAGGIVWLSNRSRWTCVARRHAQGLRPLVPGQRNRYCRSTCADDRFTRNREKVSNKWTKVRRLMAVRRETLKNQAWRRKGPGGPTGLQNRPGSHCGCRRVRLPPPSATISRDVIELLR